MLCLCCDLSSVMNQQTLQQLAIQKLLSMLHHYKPDLIFPMESVTSCCLSDLYMNPNYRSILLQDVFLFIYDHLYDDEINRICYSLLWSIEHDLLHDVLHTCYIKSLSLLHQSSLFQEYTEQMTKPFRRFLNDNQMNYQENEYWVFHHHPQSIFLSYS